MTHIHRIYARIQETNDFCIVNLSKLDQIWWNFEFYLDFVSIKSSNIEFYQSFMKHNMKSDDHMVIFKTQKKNLEEMVT